MAGYNFGGSVKRINGIKHMKTLFRRGLNQSSAGTLGAKYRIIHSPGGRR